MLGVYFSATGNTKYCVEPLVKKLDKKSETLSIEDPKTLTAIQHSNSFIFGYGVRFSNVPKIVHDWILTNKSIFNGKKILIVATMGAFRGDGSGCAARLFQKCGAKIVGGLHLRMWTAWFTTLPPGRWSSAMTQTQGTPPSAIFPVR